MRIYEFFNPRSASGINRMIMTLEDVDIIGVIKQRTVFVLLRSSYYRSFGEEYLKLR